MRAVLVVAGAIVMSMLVTATAYAVVRPSSYPIAWGAAGPRVAVPGPARIAPPTSKFPTYDGTGYSVYVCHAAKLAGYGTGNMNEAFNFSTNFNNTTQNDGENVKLGAGGFASIGAFTRGFNASDTCNNWKAGVSGGLLLRRLPGQPFWRLDKDGAGDLGGSDMRFDFDVGGGLAVRHLDMDADVTGYKTKGNVGDGDPGVIVVYSRLGVTRDTAPSSGISAASYPFDNAASHFRSCAYLGRYDVARPTTQPGTYPAAQGWRDGDLTYPQDFSEPPFTSHALGSIFTWPFFRAGPSSASTPWWPYMQTGPAAGNWHGNPDSTCNLSGGPSGVYFRTTFNPHGIWMSLGCGGGSIPATSYWGCRGDVGTAPEPSNALPNTGHQFVYLRSMRIFVNDPTNPTVNMAAGGMNAGGAIIGSGNTNQTKEVLNWNPKDDAGIRRVQVRVDGILKQDTLVPCDHRFRIPCPGGSGTSAVLRPPMPIGGLPDQFLMDVDPMTIGLHTVQVSVQDGSGRWGSQTATFRINTPRREEVCTNGGAAPIGGTSSVVTRTGVYGTDKVTAQVEVCQGRTFSDPTPGTPADAPLAPGAIVALPVSGAAVFSYTLAANQRPLSVPLNPGDCQIRDHVISGAAGGSLSPRERNQIVSVTIDLRSFVKAKGATEFGGQLGEHSLRSTFDMPTRATQRYRTALGCPS